MAYPSQTHRQAILDAAVELLSKRGLHGLSIRAVAGTLQLAPNAMYHYFANRDEMLVAVAAEVSAKLHEVLLTASEGLKPKQSIRAMVEAYMSFARDHHLLYEVLVIPRPASGRDAVAPKLLWLFLVSQVTRLSGEAASPEAAVALWAIVRGTAALQSAGAFNEQMPASGLDFALDAWLVAALAKKLTTNVKSSVKGGVKPGQWGGVKVGQ
jgi:AcrR family transcriptional regulator